MSHNLVQLARMSGEFDGIEATRKRRLEKEPEGFFLDDGKGPYSCGICGEYYYGKRNLVDIKRLMVQRLLEQYQRRRYSTSQASPWR